MHLTEVFNFEGWTIRFSLVESDPRQPQPKRSVVFVHGTPWSSVVYRPVVEALTARGSHRILVYDLPGYGQSQRCDEKDESDSSSQDFAGDTSVKFQAKALRALLAHAHLDGQSGRPAPAVVAHDIAGSIVLRTHLLEGCEFESMMLLDANVVLPWGDGFYKLVRSEPSAFLKLPPDIFEAVVRAVTRSACHDPKVLQAGWEDRLVQPWISSSWDGGSPAESQRSFVRQIAQANDQDVADMLAEDLYGRVKCDVKVVWGEQDRWIPREKIEDMVKRLGDRVKETVFVPDAGHLVMLDQPSRVAIEMFDWLSRDGSERSPV